MYLQTLYLGEMQLSEGAEPENSTEETADSEPLAAAGCGAACGGATTTETVAAAPTAAAAAAPPE